jgi:adenylate kinase family enzyme/inosine/xanthosine triphosphate pyrophosphatase family protein
MIDLVFFSTNRAKVAHFRYLGSKIGIKVKSFKESIYYASYHEPRIDDRAELLRQSYVSALGQWRRRNHGTKIDTSTFFLEDTSVRINALSAQFETPGVHVKFWMRDMTFSRLDNMLKELGNDRRVTVRSDIVMHLPVKWQEVLGIDHEYLWVYGEVKGSIVDYECAIQSNLVYPWLDNKTFNRWFVPSGAKGPISTLEIYEADKNDFRAKAFQEVEKVFRSLKLLDRSPALLQHQLELPKLTSSPSIIVICGPTCAGKTTLASWMTDQYKIPHIEASDFMYKAFWERHGLRSTVRIGDFAEAALKTLPGIVATEIANHIVERQFNRAIVTGFRSPEEINIFCSCLGTEIKVEIIFLDASEAIRLARAIKRNRDDITEEKFLKRNSQEIRMGLQGIAALECVKHFDNSGSRSNLARKLLQRYNLILDVESGHRIEIIPGVGLEPFILLTLYSENESNLWLTTTEIASKLNEKFGQSKSKNNVSRYFNQEYHPYYEVRIRESCGRKTNTVEYRLSPTGLSEAKLSKYILSSQRPYKKVKKSKLNGQYCLDFKTG